MAAVTILPLGRRGWLIASRTALLQSLLITLLALAVAVVSKQLDAALSLMWGGAVVIFGRWLTALTVFRQAGAMHAATSLRAMVRGSALTWGLAIGSAPLAWKVCQLPPLPFLLGLALVTVVQTFLPWLIERTTG